MRHCTCIHAGRAHSRAGNTGDAHNRHMPMVANSTKKFLGWLLLSLNWGTLLSTAPGRQGNSKTGVVSHCTRTAADCRT